MSKQFKVCFIGPARCGKTIYTKLLFERAYESRYIPTLGVEVHPLKCEIDGETVIFNIWDCAGQAKYGGLREGYYLQSDAAIFFYDNESSCDQKCVENYNRFRECNPDAKVVHVISKTDLHDTTKHDELMIKLTLDNMYETNHCISSKDRTNILKPLIALSKELLNKSEVTFNLVKSTMI